MQRDENGILWILVCIKPTMLRDDDTGGAIMPIAKLHLMEQGYKAIWPHYAATRKAPRNRRAKIREWREHRGRYPGLLYAGLPGGLGVDPIESTPGVRGIVRFGAAVEPVPPRVINAERARFLTADGLTDPPPWLGEGGEIVYAKGDSIRSPFDVWHKYQAIVETDDGEIVRAWREDASGRRLWFAYHHHEIEAAS